MVCEVIDAHLGRRGHRPIVALVGICVNILLTRCISICMVGGISSIGIGCPILFDRRGQLEPPEIPDKDPLIMFLTVLFSALAAFGAALAIFDLLRYVGQLTACCVNLLCQALSDSERKKMKVSPPVGVFVGVFVMVLSLLMLLLLF